MIQAGDPNTRENQDDFEGLGTGGPGYSFAIEVPPEGLNYDPYTVAMANSGRPDSNGSQFFICLTDLDAICRRHRSAQRIYTIFGMVTDGREVVDAIGQVEVVKHRHRRPGRPGRDPQHRRPGGGKYALLKGQRSTKIHSEK